MLDHEGQVIHTRPGELEDGTALDSVFAAAVGPTDAEDEGATANKRETAAATSR